MSALVETLYPPPDVRRSPLSLLRWWESRRPRYNFVVGSAGLVTLSVVSAFSLVIPGPGPSPADLLAGTLAYALLANVCYTLGWVLEMLARLVWGSRAPLMGPLLFREGLIFSVGLTLLPIVLVVLTTIARVVGLLVT